ncbi:MAG: hypothetical protein PHG71_06215 [Kiritimatiellae bacterium]|nr:hypothetical protein [Kiritimatiellia bacterium]
MTLGMALALMAAADTRTHTVDWSAARKLNTKKILGTMISIR